MVKKHWMVTEMETKKTIWSSWRVALWNRQQKVWDWHLQYLWMWHGFSEQLQRLLRHQAVLVHPWQLLRRGRKPRYRHSALVHSECIPWCIPPTAHSTHIFLPSLLLQWPSGFSYPPSLSILYQLHNYIYTHKHKQRYINILSIWVSGNIFGAFLNYFIVKISFHYEINLETTKCWVY